MSLNAEVNTKSIQKEYQHLKQAKCDRYQARVNIGSKNFPSWFFFHPKPLDSPSFCLFLHLNQNIDSLYFEAYRFLKVLWRKILCKFTSRHWQAAWQDACRWNFQTYQQDMLLFAHLDTLGFNWIEEETSYFVLDSISTIAILGF